MFADQLRTALTDRPFVPFNIRMSNDRVYYVDHPELAFLTHNHSTFVLAEHGDDVHILNVQLIASLEPQPTVAK